MSPDSNVSLVEAATSLLSKAKDNGGGLELHDVFGAEADNWTGEQALSAVNAHKGLQWCLQLPSLLEIRRDESLVPPIWFVSTPTGEAFLDLRSVPPDLGGDTGAATA